MSEIPDLVQRVARIYACDALSPVLQCHRDIARAAILEMLEAMYQWALENELADCWGEHRFVEAFAKEHNLTLKKEDNG